MTQAEELTTELNKRTTRLKAAQIALTAVILLGLAFLIISNYRLTTANNKLQSQTITLLKQQKETLATVKGLGVQQTKQMSDLQKHIDCIITFFGLPNRQQLQIADVCHFIGGATGTSSVSATSPQSQQSSQSQPQQPPPVQSTTTSAPPNPPQPSVLSQVVNGLTSPLKALGL